MIEAIVITAVVALLVGFWVGHWTGMRDGRAAQFMEDAEQQWQKYAEEDAKITRRIYDRARGPH